MSVDPAAQEIVIRAKWTMDGAQTLTQAADQLRRFADSLDEMEQQGYQLDGPVSDDYGFARIAVKFVPAASSASPPAPPPPPPRAVPRR